MNTVKVKNVVIGQGIPKICVSIIGTTREDILASANKLRTVPHDLVEWRADWFDDVFDFDRVKNTLEELRKILGDTPILFTFRTANEGGEKAIDKDIYKSLNSNVIATGLADIVDVELFTGDEYVKDIISLAHSNDVKVVVSNHDFDKTPNKDEIIKRLCTMQDLGADIPKIAVMPNSKKDVITLLAATEEMASNYANQPIVTMSMASAGLVSRLSGEAFGSAITFGALEKASAPGQISANNLSKVLNIIHGVME